MTRFFILLFFGLINFSLFAQKTVKLQIQRGNTGYPNMACFSPDGNFLYTSGINDQETHLWEIKTGREIKTFPQTWLAMQFSQDGKRMFVLDESNWSILDAQTKKIIQQFPRLQDAVRFVVSQDEKMVYFYTKYQNDSYSQYMVWDEEAKKAKFNSEYVNLYLIDYQKNDFKKVKIKKLEELKKIQFLQNHFSLAFGIKTRKLDPDNPDSYDIDDHTQLINRAFVSHEFYGNFRQDSLNIPPANYNYALYKFYQNGQKIILTRLDRRLLLYDIATQKVERELYGHSAAITALQVSPDNQLLMTASEDDSVKVWDMKSGRVLRQLHGYAAPINIVKFTPDGKKLISGGEDGWVRVWDLTMGKVTSNMMHLNSIMDIALQQKGEIIASLSADRTIKIWEANTGKNLHTFKKFAQKTTYDYRFVPRLAFVPETSTLIHVAEWDYFTGGFGGRTVYGSHFTAWDTEKGQLKHYTKLLGELQTGILSDRNNQYCIWTSAMINANNLNTFFKDAEIELEQKAKIYPTQIDENGQFTLLLGGYGETTNQVLLFKSNDKSSKFALQTTLPEAEMSLSREDNNFAVLSKDHQKMYLARKDGKIYIYQSFANEPAPISQGKPYEFKKIGEWQAHNNEVNYLDISPDGKTLASAGSDGLIKLWNLTDNQLIVSLLPLRDSESFTIFTPDNYYLSNKDATKVIHFIDDEGGVYLFDQFDVQYNRPDKVLEKIGASSPEIIDTYRKAYEKRLKKQGFNLENFEKERSFNVPEIKLPQLKNYYADTQNPDYQLFIEAKDKLYKLDRLNIWVNGVPILGSKGIDLKPRQTPQLSENFNFKLSEGYNLIEVAVLNEKGVESLKESFEVNLTPAPKERAGARLYLVTIGVSKYQNPQMNLTYAQKDAQDIAQAFGNKKDIFSEIIHLPLYNENASEDQILNLKTRLGETQVNDYVIVTFSGHGLLDEKKDYYLATHAVNFSKPQEKGLAYEKFESILDGIPARHKILLIDACHSGEVDKEESLVINSRALSAESQLKGVIKARNFNSQSEKDKNKTKPETKTTDEESIDLDFDIASAKMSLPNSFELMKELFNDLRRTSGTTVISAAGGAEFALEGTDWNNGVFTYALLSGLKEMKADANKDGKISLSEIKNYVQKTVPELTGGRQQPTSRSENLINDFRVW
jgi:WD40 repeat protein